LDRNDGIEHDAIFVSLSPYEIYERKMTKQELHAAIAKLPDIQAKRIYAYYFLEMSKTEIAQAEGVSVMAVCKSISQGLKTLEKELKNFEE
jgi:RNA polymerase sigma-70 factor (ECF subfamily)